MEKYEELKQISNTFGLSVGVNWIRNRFYRIPTADLKALLDYLDSPYTKITLDNVEENRERIKLLKEEIEKRIDSLFK